MVSRELLKISFTFAVGGKDLSFLHYESNKPITNL